MTLQELIDDTRKRGIPMDKPIQFTTSLWNVKAIVAGHKYADIDCDNDVIFECEFSAGYGTRHVEARLVPVECR